MTGAAALPPAPPLLWPAEALQRQLGALLPGLSVEVVQSIDSTNSALLARARGAPAWVSSDDEAADGGNGTAADSPLVQRRRSRESRAFDPPPPAPALLRCLLVAERQTAGRGRLGREWQSQTGASLTFSLALPLAPLDWAGLSLAVGVALADALDADALHADAPDSVAPPAKAPRIGLKWPNDLWLLDAGAAAVGRKLGGILIETVAAGAQRVAVVGVGLNVRPFMAAALAGGIGFVGELDAGASAPQVLARVAEPLLRALLRFERDGFAPFAARFAARDLLHGRAVQAGGEHGIARGVSARGALLLQGAAGLREVVGGEVSVRLAAESNRASADVAPAGPESAR